MEVIVNKGSVKDKRALENATADNAAMKANLDYVAMMSNVDILTSEEDSTNGTVEELQ